MPHRDSEPDRSAEAIGTVIDRYGPITGDTAAFAGALEKPLPICVWANPLRLDRDALKRAEGELILAALPDGAQLVALDERGKSPTSRQFAKQIGDWQDDGISDIAFAIGGADGLSDAVRKHARLVLCFGAMTWPHFVVRGLLFEQLYRAQQIIAGHPYHRD